LWLLAKNLLLTPENPLSEQSRARMSLPLATEAYERISSRRRPAGKKFTGRSSAIDDNASLDDASRRYSLAVRPSHQSTVVECRLAHDGRGLATHFRVVV
jgi:hypothetical protein